MAGLMAGMNEFSIKDLESLTGIKAHTIRIWEQRYNLLSPARTGTNIRFYSGEDLKKLLNVSLLQKNGVKISKIADLTSAQIANKLAELNGSADRSDHYVSLLKLAMMEYDEEAFRELCDTYLKTHDFESLFSELFIPFLYEIGFLWQTGTVCPAQEHFVSNLIRQFIFHNVHSLPFLPKPDGKNIILFLPDQEIHEISLLMFHYIFRKRGHRTVFLGISVPMEDLIQVAEKVPNPVFVSLFVTNPVDKEVPKYLQNLNDAFSSTDAVFHLSGYMLKGSTSPNPKSIVIHNSAQEILSSIG